MHPLGDALPSLVWRRELEGVEISQFRGVMGARYGKARPRLGVWRTLLVSYPPLLEGSSLGCSRHPWGSWLEQREMWQGCPTSARVFKSGCTMIRN